MFNTDLFIDMMAQIEEAREANDIAVHAGHDQSFWGRIVNVNLLQPTNGDLIYDERTKAYVGTGTCGTAMCAAGWALTLSGEKMRWDPVRFDGDGGGTEFIANFTADGEDVPKRACELLGIDRDEAVEARLWDYDDNEYPKMFDHTNTVDMLYGYGSRHAAIDNQPDTTPDDLRRRVATVRQQWREQRAAMAAKGYVGSDTP